jgi:ribonuclease T2
MPDQWYQVPTKDNWWLIWSKHTFDNIYIVIDTNFQGGGSGGGSGGGGTSGSLPSKATIHALQSGTQTGGLLSAATWSTQTLATFTISGTADSFTMKSSKGNCGINGGTLSCGSGVSSTSFSAVTSGSNLLLASGGSTAFTSSGKPSGTTVFAVNTGSSGSQDYTLAIVST